MSIASFFSSLTRPQRAQIKRELAAETKARPAAEGEPLEEEEEPAAEGEGEGEPREEEEEEEEEEEPMAQARPARRSAATQVADPRALAARLAKVERENAQIKAKLRTERYLTEAKKLSVPGASTRQLAQILSAADARLPAAEAAGLRQILASTSAVVRRSAVFRELGAAAGGDATGAEAKIHSLATGLMAADPKLTRPQAVSQVLERHPELYDEHLSG